MLSISKWPNHSLLKLSFHLTSFSKLLQWVSIVCIISASAHMIKDYTVMLWRWSWNVREGHNFGSQHSILLEFDDLEFIWIPNKFQEIDQYHHQCSDSSNISLKYIITLLWWRGNIWKEMTVSQSRNSCVVTYCSIASSHLA